MSFIEFNQFYTKIILFIASGYNRHFMTSRRYLTELLYKRPRICLFVSKFMHNQSIFISKFIRSKPEQSDYVIEYRFYLSNLLSSSFILDS
jgi:hypothetical protein